MVGTRTPRAAITAGLVALTLLIPAGPSKAADPPPTATIILEGGGWGHGIGMSQYGAKAQALAGWTASETTGFYYPGTEVVDAAELPIPPEKQAQPLWVGLTQHRSATTLSWPGTTGSICIDPDPSHETDPCEQSIAVGVDEQIRFEWVETHDHCTITRIEAGGDEVLLSTTAPQCRASAIAAPSGAIWLGAQGYAVNSIELRRAFDAESFHVVAVIDMETYVAGLAEMPSSWPAAAQEAQMLAGRTFALNRYLHFENPELRAPGDAGLPDTQQAKCWCHVYDTTASQVYGGIEATTSERVAAAAATSNQVIAYFGADAASYTKSNVIESLYSSSNGGRTMANTDAFGSTKQYPYLIAIDDPWSIDPAAENPNAAWAAERTPEVIAESLEWDMLRGIWLLDTNPSVVRFEGIDNGEIVVADLKGDALRRTAQLLSGQVTQIRVEGVPTCAGYIATLWGTAQADTLIGTATHDVIIGRGGNDVIRGRGGHDIICGGPGDDTIRGNSGNDLIYAGADHDLVYGNAGLDIVHGGGGDDTIHGGGGADTLEGNAGNDTIYGGFGPDLVRGGGGMDVLDGQGGADTVVGNTGNDQLMGGAHSDTLKGGPHSDILDGGDGFNDRCTGGSGADTATEACEVVDSVP